MAAGIIKKEDIQVQSRAVDFVTMFGNDISGTMTMLGVTYKHKMAPGSLLRMYSAEMTLEEAPAEGEVTPRSKATVKETFTDPLKVERYAKEVTIDAVQSKGYDAAVVKTDEEFRNQLLGEIHSRLYKGLEKGTLTVNADSFKKALARALFAVKNQFKKLNRSATMFCAFVNMLDFGEYLGDAELTTQQSYGMTYIENFLGYDKIFLCDETEVPAGKMYVTPSNNLQLEYMDVSNSDFAKMGLSYTIDSDTGLVGYANVGDYDKGTGVSYAIMGMAIWPELANGIAVVTFTGGYQTMSAPAGAGTQIPVNTQSDDDDDDGAASTAKTTTSKSSK